MLEQAESTDQILTGRKSASNKDNHWDLLQGGLQLSSKTIGAVQFVPSIESLSECTVKEIQDDNFSKVGFLIR